MTEPRETPRAPRERAAAAAARFLDRLLATRDPGEGPRLPTTRALARAAGVSVNAMGSAVQRLCAEGRLAARPRRGITVAGPAPDTRLTAEPGRRTGPDTLPALHELIAREILDGPLRGYDILPSPKQLCRRYGVCFRTLRKALDRLRAAGLLRAEGPRRRVCRSWAGQSATIACVLPQGFVRETPGFQASRWHAEFVRVFGQSCGAHGITPQVTTFPSTPSALATQLSRLTGLLGVVLWTPGQPGTCLGDLIAGLSRHVHHFAVFDPGADARVPTGRAPSTRLTVVRTALDACGRQMGCHLLAHGHHRAAYFSPYHDRAWSRRRLAGLTEAFAAAGHRSGVCAHVLESPGRAATGEALAGPAAAIQTPVVDRATAAARQAVVRAGVAIYDDSLLRGAVGWYAEQAALRSLMRPVLETALEDRAVTAWVGANDKIACLLLEFLRSRRVQVPKSISVAGFDDTLEGMQAGITSYNFDIPRAAMRVVSLLAFPNLSRRPGTPREEEVAGMVVPRESVGRPEARPAGGLRKA